MLTEMKQVWMALYVAHMNNICRQITVDVGHSNSVRANLDRLEMHASLITRMICLQQNEAGIRSGKHIAIFWVSTWNTTNGIW